MKLVSRSLSDVSIESTPADAPVLSGSVEGHHDGALTLSSGEGHVVRVLFTSAQQAYNVMLAAKLVGDAMEAAGLEFHVRHGKKRG